MLKSLISRKPSNSVQSIQRKQLETQIATQREAIEDARALLGDMKEVHELKALAASNQKELDALMAEIAGINQKQTKA